MILTMAATLSATVYRRSGAGRTLQEHLTGVMVTRPVSADVRRIGAMIQVGIIQSVINVFEVFTAGEHDILQGDEIEIAANRYIVHGVSAWSRANTAAMQLTLELVRK